MRDPWSTILAEAAGCFGRPGGLALAAYSEFMPPPYLGLKPQAPARLAAPALPPDGWAISEYEQAQELEPGLARIASHLCAELRRLASGHPHEVSHAMLAGNAAWTPELAAGAPAPAAQPLALALPLSLSRTQDDKGRVRWTLFGASHHGPARAFWGSFGDADSDRFLRLLAWAIGAPPSGSGGAGAGPSGPVSGPPLSLRDLRVLPRAPEPDAPGFDDGPLPAFARGLRLAEGESLARVRALVTFESFSRLPPEVRQAHLRGALLLFPHPASLVFFEHPGCRRLAKELCWALQLPLLHLFPRHDGVDGLRVPQSGWLDELHEGGALPSGERRAHAFARTHRWQRVERDEEEAEPFADPVTKVLFSTHPDDLGLYGKPMARNAQIWTEGYAALLDGPWAAPGELERAHASVRAGGRFGYRFLYPPMRAGGRSIFWHRPLVARLDPSTGAVTLAPEPPLGYLGAEGGEGEALLLVPRLLDRPGHRQAARLFARDPGRARQTTANNARKILEFAQLLGGALPEPFALRLLHAAKGESLAQWHARLPERSSDAPACQELSAELASRLSPPPVAAVEAAGEPRSLTFAAMERHAFEEALWRDIALLAHGEFRDKDNADAVHANEGRTGGRLGLEARRRAAQARDNDRLADYLHGRYRALIAQSGMEGKAYAADHRFRWETDFLFPWSGGWADNRERPGERNVVLVIPGRSERRAIAMCDHYDTAYMEDLYEPARGGDRFRASAAGADDNHSATAALLRAAEVLLPLAREGRLERTVWLVHLTGEEFPADCLGARALARGLVEGRLAFQRDGVEVDASGTTLEGAFVLDMVGHNNPRDRDVFQIAPGEGAAAARLALRAHRANERWNRAAERWNRSPERRGRGRSQRVDSPAEPPPVAEHLALAGEVRPEWDPRSALYNTDGQIFSDVGVPVVLLMENYDIRRSGYHDTHDTLKNIDLDYAAALASIAIEAVADCACAPTLEDGGVADPGSGPPAPGPRSVAPAE